MYNTIIFTDWHVHNYKMFDKNGSRLDNCVKVARIIFKYAHKNGINRILFGGDLFDKQQTIPTAVIDSVVETFAQLFETYPNIHFVAISGNHDHATKNLPDAPAITALRFLAISFPNNFFLIDNDCYDICDENYRADSDGKEYYARVHGIPYYEHPEHYQEKLQEVAETKMIAGANILLIHQTPKGIGHALIPHDTDPADELYSNFNMVFCGHIHARQELNPKFLVVGSPIHRDRADEGEDKGFYVFDIFNPADRKFVSLNKKFPVFHIAESELEASCYDQKDFVVLIPKIDHISQAEAAKTESFNTALKPEQLIENFWLETDGKDKDLLAVGLSFIS